MNLKKSLIFNSIISIFVAFSLFSMFTGFHFMGSQNAMSAANLSMFKFFTVDSNVFAGIASFLLVIEEAMALKNHTHVSKFHILLKFVATASVTLTLLVTVFFLSPQLGKNFFVLFMNANLFMHLATPLLCIYSFIKYENVKLSFPTTFLGMIPMFLYAAFYVIHALPHAQANRIAAEYDWYGFFMFGVDAFWIVFLVICIVMFGISFILWKQNQKRV